MADQIGRCSGCRVQLLVPPEVRTIRCAVCGAITHVRRPNDSIVRVNEHVRQAANWVKGLISNVSSSINSYGQSTTLPPLAPVMPGYGYYPTYRMPMYPQLHGKKRALLCGICYRSRSYELKGSVNDVRCMKYMLCEKYGFPDDSILVLTEEETNPFRIPTKQNIRNAMHWLISGCKSGDSLVFQFSGHGSQQVNYRKEEMDNYNETLCPLDYETEGMIVDDEINATIVRPLPTGAQLHAIIDACHSGTVLDLPFLCRIRRTGEYQWEDHRPPSLVNKGTSGGLAICFSGCDDNQTSADTSALSGTATTGAMTYSFIEAVQNEPGKPYGYILNAMRSAIRDAKMGIRISGPIASLIRTVFHIRLTQVCFSCFPMISSEESVIDELGQGCELAVLQKEFTENLRNVAYPEHPSHRPHLKWSPKIILIR